MPSEGERFNTLTHLAGLILAIFGLTLLAAQAIDGGGGAQAAGALIFAVAVALLYAASTLCHWSQGAAKTRWERLDHAAIFLLIAGTVTPFALVSAADVWSMVGLATVWALSASGIAQEMRRGDQTRPSVLMYVVVGWLAVAVAFRACREMPLSAGVLLLAGGLIYTAGTLFYLNPGGVRHAHGIWHLFVLAGTAAHYAAVVAFAI